MHADTFKDLASSISLPSSGSSKLPILLSLDTSNSVRSEGRDVELESSMRGWIDDLRNDRDPGAGGELDRELALQMVGGGVITVAPRGDGQIVGDGAQAFVSAHELGVPRLVFGGATPLGEAIASGVQTCRERTEHLKKQSINSVRPNFWLITDGKATDVNGYEDNSWTSSLGDLRKAEANGELLVFTVGLEGADREALKLIAPHSHFFSTELDFVKSLELVSIASMQSAGVADMKNAYALTREILGVDENGDLR